MGDQEPEEPKVRFCEFKFCDVIVFFSIVSQVLLARSLSSNVPIESSVFQSHSNVTMLWIVKMVAMRLDAVS